jgi:hypothetical protein
MQEQEQDYDADLGNVPKSELLEPKVRLIKLHGFLKISCDKYIVRTRRKFQDGILTGTLLGHVCSFEIFGWESPTR